MSRLKRLIVEIHRRSLWQVLGIYLVGAWIGYEVIQSLTEGLGLPSWFPGLAILLLIVGLPIVIATACVHEDAAPTGPSAEPDAVEQGSDAVEEPVPALPSTPARHRRITWRNAGLSFVVALAVWGVVATVWLVANPRVGVDDAIADEAEPGIAVLPFSVRGVEEEVWGEGMVNLLSANLDGVPGLRSIDSRTVFARWSESVPATGEVDRETALRIARATGAKYALLGSAVSLGGEVRLTADIYETESGNEMGQAQVQGSTDSILSLVDQLAVQSLVVTLQQVESELPEIDLASVTTSSIPALTAWLEGEVHFRHGNDVAAAAAYERALDHDSTFAFAYYRLSSAYGWAEGMSSYRAEEAREKAFRWVDRLPPRQAALVHGLWAWEIGERREAYYILRQLVQSYPDYADAWHELGDFYYHAGPAIPVSLDDALECFIRAVELDPGFAPYRIHLVDIAFKHDPDSARVADLLAEYRQLGSADAAVTLQLETAFDLAFGSEDRRARALQALDTLSNIGLLPSNNLLHPRFWRELEAVHLARERRWNRDLGPSLFFGTAWGRGLAERGFGYLDRLQTPVEIRACYTLFWRQAGLPVSARRLAELDVLTNQIDSLESSFPLYCAGAHAADRGLWEEHGRAVEALEEMSRRSIAAGGTGGTEHRYALAAQAYGLWRQGRPEAALAVLEDVRRYDATNIIRWTLEIVLTDLERWDEVIPYLQAGWWDNDALRHYNLARAYEHTGEHEKARKEYAFFVEAWQDADPELQPWVEDARRALDRLTSER